MSHPLVKSAYHDKAALLATPGSAVARGGLNRLHACVDGRILGRDAAGKVGDQAPAHQYAAAGTTSMVRTVGTDWVGATLNEGGNCHLVCTRLNSRSIATSSGDTYLPHINALWQEVGF